jgi:hypothetical protein
MKWRSWLRGLATPLICCYLSRSTLAVRDQKLRARDLNQPVTGEIPDSHRWDSSPKMRFAPVSPLEEDGFELAVPPRRERLRAATPGKHCRFGPEPVSGSAFRAAVSDWQYPEEPFAGAGPMVRIRFPPAESLSLARIRLRTSRTPAFRAGCARLVWRPGRQRRARCFDIAPTGGNISAGPYSSTAVPLMWSPRMPGRSQRSRAFSA